MFIYELSAKFFSLFMTLVLFFNGFAIDAPLFASSDDVDIEYTFDNDDAYSAAGTVSVTAKTDGEYDLFWGDADGKRLSLEVEGRTAYYSEFASVDVENGSGSAEIYEFTAIPDGAEQVLAYKNRVFKASDELPDEKIREAEKPDYLFGALSDLHFNRYHLSLTDDAALTFPNALNFLDAFDISFVGMSGDLSNSGERDSFEKFNYFVSKHDFPVYTSTGNHDVHENADRKAWQELVNTGVYGDEKAPGIVEVGVNGVDFVYAPDNADGDIFIFFSQNVWDYNKDTSRLVTDEQLDWLDAQFKKYEDRRVFLFFHTFIANDNGDNKTGEGNLVNNSGVTYGLCYTTGTPDEARFRGLLKTYKNVIFFNGHSHWSFAMQEFNPIMNITDYNGTYATLVHISSVSSPRTVTADASDNAENYMRSSEGYLVRVYKDKIVLTGVDFLKGQFLSYATFVINK